MINKEVACENCGGEGMFMTVNLYPSGHTEVDEICEECDGEGYVLISTLVEVPEVSKDEILLLLL